MFSKQDQSLFGGGKGFISVWIELKTVVFALVCQNGVTSYNATHSMERAQFSLVIGIQRHGLYHEVGNLGLRYFIFRIGGANRGDVTHCSILTKMLTILICSAMK